MCFRLVRGGDVGVALGVAPNRYLPLAVAPGQEVGSFFTFFGIEQLVIETCWLVGWFVGWLLVCPRSRNFSMKHF